MVATTKPLSSIIWLTGNHEKNSSLIRQNNNCKLTATRGFSLIEMIVYVAIVAIVISAIVAFNIWVIQVGTKAKISRAVLDNSRRTLETLTYEIRRSQSVYAPNSVLGAHPGQLSFYQISTSTPDETGTFIDFFLCDEAICLKKEGIAPIALTDNQVRVTNLTFNQLFNSTSTPSIQIVLRLESAITSNRPEYADFIEITTAVNLRSY